MSAEIDAITTVLADLKAKRAKLDVTIEGLEEHLASMGINASSIQRVSGSQGIAADAFLTLTLGDAAIKYLGMIRKIQTVPQIVEALKQGGLHHAKVAAVYTALFRRAEKVGDVIKFEDNSWGLAEWYATNPNIKRKQKAAKPQESQTETSNEVQTPTTKKRAPRSGTMVDACEQILRKVNHPLHAEKFVERLASDYNKNTNVKSIAGTLPQDGQERFENLGNNVWALKEWPENMKAPYRKGNRKEATLPI